MSPMFKRNSSFRFHKKKGMKMVNMSKRRQPVQRADNRQRLPMGPHCNEIVHFEYRSWKEAIFVLQNGQSSSRVITLKIIISIMSLDMSVYKLANIFWKFIF